MPTGIDHYVTFGIYLNGRKKPLLFDTGHLLSIHGWNVGRRSAERLNAKYREIAIRTFNKRIQCYLDALHEYGYFYYDGKKIAKDGTVEGDSWRFNLQNDKPLLRHPFAIIFEKEKQGWFTRNRRMGIATVIDEDVFMVLLKELFDLSWPQ